MQLLDIEDDPIVKCQIWQRDEMVPIGTHQYRFSGTVKMILRALFHWCEIAVLVRWRHTHGGIDWWWWSWTIWSPSRT